MIGGQNVRCILLFSHSGMGWECFVFILSLIVCLFFFKHKTTLFYLPFMRKWDHILTSCIICLIHVYTHEKLLHFFPSLDTYVFRVKCCAQRGNLFQWTQKWGYFAGFIGMTVSANGENYNWQTLVTRSPAYLRGVSFPINSCVTVRVFLEFYSSLWSERTQLEDKDSMWTKCLSWTILFVETRKNAAEGLCKCFVEDSRLKKAFDISHVSHIQKLHV